MSNVEEVFKDLLKLCFSLENRRTEKVRENQVSLKKLIYIPSPKIIM